MQGHDVKRLRTQQVIDEFGDWAQFKRAITEDDKETLIYLVERLVFAEAQYEKRTFEVNDELLEELRVYCVTNKLNQKDFINIGIQYLLILKDMNELKFREWVTAQSNHWEQPTISFTKRTFEIKETKLTELRHYCTERKLKQKNLINIAIDTLLHGEIDEDVFSKFI